MRRQAMKLFWKGRLFRREGQKVVTVVTIAHRDGVMTFMIIWPLGRGIDYEDDHGQILVDGGWN